MNYLSVGSDAKTVKGEKRNVLTGILYLAPHTLGGGESLCKFSTPGCRRVCLYTAGHGAFAPVQAARIRKSRAYQDNPDEFVSCLVEDIEALRKQAITKGMVPAVRLNGTSDILWEAVAPSLLDWFGDIQFYDYTKYPPDLRKDLPVNYHLTYSFSEFKKSEEWARGWFKRGFNTSAVFHDELPSDFLGHPVINGDESDLRFLDPPGCIVGLKVKGKARHDDGDGFVQRRAA